MKPQVSSVFSSLGYHVQGSKRAWTRRCQQAQVQQKQTLENTNCTVAQLHGRATAACIRAGSARMRAGSACICADAACTRAGLACILAGSTCMHAGWVGMREYSAWPISVYARTWRVYLHIGLYECVHGLYTYVRCTNTPHDVEGLQLFIVRFPAQVRCFLLAIY